MIRTALCDNFKLDILMGRQSSKDIYMMALYSDDAELGSFTTEYTATGEVSGSGYTDGGKQLENVRTYSEGGSAFLVFDEVRWENVSIAASGCMIYNQSAENRAVATFSFGKTVEARNGKFTVEIPSSGKNGLICIL